jgi:hypothetical protein
MIAPSRRSASSRGDGFALSDTKIILQVNGTSYSAQLKEISSSHVGASNQRDLWQESRGQHCSVNHGRVGSRVGKNDEH